MTQEDQQERFDEELDALIERFLEEYDLTFASMLGVLRITQARIEAAVIEAEDDDDEVEDWKS